MKFIKKLLCDFYKIFIVKDDRYIGYTPGNFLCDRFIHSFMLRYPRKHLSEETIQRVDDVGTVMGFNDDHLVKYLCLNIIDIINYNFSFRSAKVVLFFLISKCFGLFFLFNVKKQGEWLYISFVFRIFVLFYEINLVYSHNIIHTERI